MLTPEEKFLIAVYGEKVFGGGFVRQSMPSCCGRVIDLEKISAVKFIDIEVDGSKVTLIMPLCPLCGSWVIPTYSIVN